MSNLTVFSVRTPVGTSKSGHGISFRYNQTEVGQENRTAAVRRNKENQRNLGAWHNESRGKPNEIPFPKRRTN